MAPLFIIPARAGSKGLPGKNSKLLAGKSLIEYALNMARVFVGDERICITTDSEEIIRIVAKKNYHAPFKRPIELATDTTSMNDVLIHALQYYAQTGIDFDRIVLLQPTSPFRTAKQVDAAMNSFNSNLDMVVSVCESKANPYFVLYEENSDGFLKKILNGQYDRRQDLPKVFQVNGAVYIINPQSLKETGIQGFKKIKKIMMGQQESIDIDTEADWLYAEFLLKKKIIDVSKLFQR
jgi:CMP-N,N'-diacetyllegionaminic acid synthase